MLVKKNVTFAKKSLEANTLMIKKIIAKLEIIAILQEN